MAISLKHTFQSAKSDGADTTLVQPSNWNAEHTFTAAAGTVLGRNTSGAGAVQELPIAVDSSGNVGIGTSSPGARLAVNGGTGTSQTRFEVNTTQVQEVCTNAAANAYADRLADASQYVWKITSTERMRLDSSGNVGIGTSSISARLVINGGGSNSQTRFEVGTSEVQEVSTNAAANAYANRLYDASRHIWKVSNSEQARIDTNGYLLLGYTTSNGTYRLQVNSQIFATSSTIATSDGRYKENVTPLQGALGLVKALRPVSFDWKEHPVHAFDRAQPTIGFIAQEVQEALAGQPYANSIIKANECTIEPEETDPDTGEVIKPGVKEDFLGIAEGNLIALLTAALQEADARIDALETRLLALEAK